MKISAVKRMFYVFLAVAFVFTFADISSCEENNKSNAEKENKHESKKTTMYVCSVHPSTISYNQGKCPFCGREKTDCIIDKYFFSKLMLSFALITAVLFWWTIFHAIKRTSAIKKITVWGITALSVYYIIYHISIWTWWIYCINADIKEYYSRVCSEEVRKSNLITNIKALVERYSGYEKGLFTYSADSNRKLMRGNEKNEQSKLSSKYLNVDMGKLLAIAEKYPDLKANNAFIRLMDELAVTESRIAEEKKAYNEVVAVQNNRITTIPLNMLNIFYNENIVRYVTTQDNLIEKMDYNHPDSFYNW